MIIPMTCLGMMTSPPGGRRPRNCRIALLVRITVLILGVVTLCGMATLVWCPLPTRTGSAIVLSISVVGLVRG